jgi:NADH dehydrogenase
VCLLTAQHAIRQALTGQNLSMVEGATPSFRYRTPELVARPSQRRRPSARCDRDRFFAWFLWRSYYLLRLPTLSRKVRVALDWSIDLMFPPDVADPATADPGPDLGGPVTPPGS